MINVGQFFTRLTPKLHGTTINKIGNRYELLEEAAANLLAEVDPPTVMRRARIANAIYDKVYNYTAPTDLADEGAVVDLRPISEGGRTNVESTFVREFDRKKKWKDLLTLEVLNAVKTLRIAIQNLDGRTTLHECNSTTLDGTVTAGGDATFTDEDYLDYVSGRASLKFGLSGATGSATFTFALSTAFDISKLEDIGALFHWLKFPDASRLNSVTLRWGSSASDYWSKTVTAAQDRDFESDAWMLEKYDWSTASETGSPVASAVDYLQIIISYDTGVALSNVKLDAITASLGEAWEVLYYSNALFRDATGVTYKTIPTADTDIILLDADGLMLLEYEFLKSAAQQVRGRNMARDVDYCNKRLGSVDSEIGLYYAFSGKHPSQRIVRSETYYEFGDENDGYTDD